MECKNLKTISWDNLWEWSQFVTCHSLSALCWTFCASFGFHDNKESKLKNILRRVLLFWLLFSHTHSTYKIFLIDQENLTMLAIDWYLIELLEKTVWEETLVKIYSKFNIGRSHIRRAWTGALYVRPNPNTLKPLLCTKTSAARWIAIICSLAWPDLISIVAPMGLDRTKPIWRFCLYMYW